MFRIESSRKAEKFMEKVDPKTLERIREALLTLETDPAPIQFYDTLKLAGRENDYRIRIGRIRVQYTVYWEEKYILVFDIGWRKDNTYK